jgi:hypothetical protein
LAFKAVVVTVQDNFCHRFELFADDRTTCLRVKGQLSKSKDIYFSESKNPFISKYLWQFPSQLPQTAHGSFAAKGWTDCACSHHG